MEYKKRAARAKALLRDENFLSALEDLRERQKIVFVSSAAHEVEKREEAHSIVRALNQIEYLLQGDIDAETLVDKKGSAPQWRLNLMTEVSVPWPQCSWKHLSKKRQHKKIRAKQ